MPRNARAQTPTPSGPRLIGKAVRTPSTPSPQAAPSMHARIAVRAYEFFLQEGAEHGRDVRHWLRAEQELLEPEVPARATGSAASAARSRPKA